MPEKKRYSKDSKISFDTKNRPVRSFLKITNLYNKHASKKKKKKKINIQKGGAVAPTAPSPPHPPPSDGHVLNEVDTLPY